MSAKIRFLIALTSAIKNGAVKTIQQAMAFAKREFGEIDKSFVDDIVNVFKKEGKTKKGDVVPIKKEGLVRRPEEFATRKQYEKYLDETLGPSDDVFGSPIKEDLLKEWDKVKAKNVTPKEGILAADAATEIVKKRTKDISKGDPTGETGDLMNKIEADLENLKKTNKKLQETTEGLTDSPFDDFYNYVLGGGKARDPKVGMVRTAAREILNKNKIKIGREDPIEVLRKTYGEDALEAVDAIGDDLLLTQTYGEIDNLLTKNKLFDLKPKKISGYDESVVAGEKLRKAQEQEAKNKRILEEFDPDREPSAHGGIAGQLHLNRTGFKVGGIKKGIDLVAKHGPEFKKFAYMLFIKTSNMIRQGKGMFKNLTEKQRIVQHDNLTKKGDTFQKEGTLEGMDQYFGINAEKAFVEAQAKVRQSTAGEIKKGVADVMKDTSEAGLARSIEIDNLKLEFPGITDELINDILTDTNPQRIAEVKATLKEALKMREKGMGADEIIDMFKKTPRTRNAEGGLINVLKL